MLQHSILNYTESYQYVENTLNYYINTIIATYVKIVKNNKNNWLWFNVICGMIVGICLHVYTYTFVGGDWSIIYGFSHHLTTFQFSVMIMTSFFLGFLLVIINTMIRDFNVEKR